jgi:DNA-binding beta-propeller fold protein YncE
METRMNTQNFRGIITARLATLIVPGLLLFGCNPDSGTEANSDAESGSGKGGGSGQPTDQGGSAGSAKGGAAGSVKGGGGGGSQGGGGGGAKGGAAGSGQGAAAGSGQGAAAGSEQGGVAGTGKGGNAGSGQGAAAGSGKGGSAGSGQGGAAGTGQGGAGGSNTSTSSGFRSPYAIAFSSDSSSLVVSDATAGELVVLDPKAGTSVRFVKLDGEPKGLAWSGTGKVMVAEYGAGTIAEVDTAAGSVARRLDVGAKPTDVALSADGAKVVVPDHALGQVLILETASGKTVATVPVAPYPFAVAVAPTGSTAVVTHLLASGDATAADAGASVSLVDIAGGKLSANIKLPLGSSSVRGVHCSTDGKWAYVVHTLARLNIPTTHLLRGWINTDALSIIDLNAKSIYATVLLDRLNEGFADPWGVRVSPDGKYLWVSSSGAHQVARVDLTMLHKLLAGPIPTELVKSGGKTPSATARSKSGYNKPLSDVWFDIAADSKKRSLLMDDLGALASAGLIQIFRLAPAQGPRGVAVSPDGKQVAVAVYFSGQVGILNAATPQVEKYINVGTQADESWTRLGERIFHDATRTLQSWLSCATCHPQGRSDGLSWDLLNDGSGNPKNSHTMLYSPNTPPVMSHGVRADAATAITAGLKGFEFAMPNPGEEEALGNYLNALTAESYNKIGAQKSAAAQRGEAVFKKAACDTCHSGKFFTDLKPHDVGTKGKLDLASDTPEFYTYTLADLWRSAPYLHDGSAATLKDVLTTKNVGDKHGKTSTLTAQEIDDLVQYQLELDPPAPDKVDVFKASSPTPPKAALQGQVPTASKGLDLTDPKLANLDKILFIKRDYLPTDDNGKGGHICDQYHGFNDVKGGGLFIIENVLSGTATEKNVLASSTCANGPHQGKKLEGGAFLSPDLSYDGKQILFAYSDVSGSGWSEGSVHHIFKVNVDGTGLTQLTQGKSNDFDPTWLPDGRIAFVSDRRGGYGRCHPRQVPVYTLYIMNADGTGIEAISYHETNEWHPSVDRNGLLIYTRWDYVDRGSNQVHHPWVTTPDGLDARATVGNYAYHGNIVPRAVMNVRDIPGTNKIVGTAAAHHQQAYGSIVVMDNDIEEDDEMGQYTVVTKDAGFPEATVDKSADHKYATAWPIDEHRFLVVHDPDSNTHGLTGKRFGIYLIDDQGGKKLLYKDSARSCLDPIPLAPRTTPRIVPMSRTLTTKTDPAEINLLNVYDSMLPFPSGTTIKALRVVQLYPKSTAITIQPKLGHGAVLYNDQNGRGSLGTVPVESDGSAHFLLPPGKPVYFQALDESGAAVQSMMSSTYIIPGQPRMTCQGCHERRYRAPHARTEMPIALRRAASTLQPEADGSAPFSFARLIQPILDKYCVSCHGTSKPGDLSKGNYSSNADKFYTSYVNLRPYLSYYNVDYAWGPVVTQPGKFGARASKLYSLLKGGHQNVALPDADLRSIALWLDLNSDMFSDDVQRDAQASGQAVKPSIE